jgi:hypothetical protein
VSGMARSSSTEPQESRKLSIPPGVAISETGSRWPLPDGEEEKLSVMDRILDWFIALRKR